MAPFVAILCGKEPTLVEFMKKSLGPNIEIIHVCSSTEAALSEIPSILKGGAVASTDERSSPSNKEVSFVIVGGLFPPEDVEKIKAAADAVRPLPFFIADRSKVPPGSTGPAPPEIIKQRILAAVAATEKAEGQWDPEVHKF